MVTMNNYMVTRELRHEAWFYDEIYFDRIDYCGSERSHNRGTCPTNNIDNHYELNVLFDTLVKAKNLKEAREMQLDWKIKIKQDEELDDYLKEVGITKFNHDDFIEDDNLYEDEYFNVKRLNTEQYNIFKKSADGKGYRLRITHQRICCYI